MNAYAYKNPDVQTAYDRHADMLFRLSYSILFSREDAEDVVHDVFVKYVSKSPAFHEYEHEKAWFVRVTINHCHDLLRHKKIRSYIPLDDIGEIPAKEYETDDVLKSVLALPDKYKLSILIHYYEGYSVEQTSKMLGISKSAVKMRLARGRDMLKKELDGGMGNV
jgi:RNA polymerase sigma factor (sigma-70 family)